MSLSENLARWLDIRPNEVRRVVVSFLGAFLVISFLVLARSLREALYLDVFDVTTLPYITIAVAVLGLPAVALFSRYLAHENPREALTKVALFLAGGLLLVWPLVGRQDAGVIAFYLWTAGGTLLLTSGFWVATSEQFPVRGAKRLFGLISAGGTLGAMVTGNSVRWLTARFDSVWLIALLPLFLLLLIGIQRLLPRPTAASAAPASKRSPEERITSLREGPRPVWRTPHLRTIALIVLTATMASTLVDYQFKEQVRASLVTKEQLASFFGAFYGWTGGISLAVQLLVTSRLMATAGVAWSLSILPAVLLLGSTGLLVAPGLALATLVRGADTSLRKSLHRSVIEFLYVPVPPLLRRKTKTLIDFTVDSVAEGLGALIVFLWVTLPGLPSRYLSIFVILLAVLFLFLSRAMGRRYFVTLKERLAEGGERPVSPGLDRRLAGRDALTATVTRMDMTDALRARGLGLEGRASVPAEPEERPASLPPPGGRRDAPRDLSAVLASSDVGLLAAALSEPRRWGEEHVPALVRVLARDALAERVIEALAAIGEPAVPHLATLLADESADFVIRRRIPGALARIGAQEADAALVDALGASRFEIRYRAALALARRRRDRMPEVRGDWKAHVWEAVRRELSRERPVWELQRLLDRTESSEDDFVARRAGVRGELSLEHTFRLLSFVLEPEAVRSAYHGIILDDENLKSYSLEYLEQVLPPDIRQRLWPFIGDISEYRRERAIRPLPEVVSDLMKTGATLFAGKEDREALRRVLGSTDGESADGESADGE
ncbi:MAG: Npt1/Npt2 family nucleotide transporter [Gemmatimonadota bacterium]